MSKLPDNYKVKGSPEFSAFLTKLRSQASDFLTPNAPKDHYSGDHYDWYFIDDDGKISCGESNNRKEITVDELNKLYEAYNNPKPTKTPDKPIISYKLIKHEYEEFALGIANLGLSWKIGKDALYDLENTPKYNVSIPNLKKSGILDLWFEPIYEEIVNLPNINGYKGEIKDNKVVYGCQSYTFDDIKNRMKNLNEYKLSDDVVLTLNGRFVTVGDFYKVYNELKRLNKI